MTRRETELFAAAIRNLMPSRTIKWDAESLTKVAREVTQNLTFEVTEIEILIGCPRREPRHQRAIQTAVPESAKAEHDRLVQSNNPRDELYRIMSERKEEL